MDVIESCQSEGGRNLFILHLQISWIRLLPGITSTCARGGARVTHVKEYSVVSTSRGQESGLISARRQTRLSLHTPRARGSPRLREETCQSHSDVRCGCNAWMCNTPPSPTSPAHPEVPDGNLFHLWKRRASEAAYAAMI